MQKHPFKRIIFGFFIFMLVLTAGYFSYTATLRNTFKKTGAYSVPIEENVSAANAPLLENEIIKTDYYFVRYDERGLSVYACTGDKKEFLYTLKTRIEDISEEELQTLKNGVILKDKQALAAFEEDFTS